MLRNETTSRQRMCYKAALKSAAASRLERLSISELTEMRRQHKTIIHCAVPVFSWMTRKAREGSVVLERATLLAIKARSTRKFVPQRRAHMDEESLCFDIALFPPHFALL